MSEKFIIQGGNPLKGTVEVRGAKNAAFPVMTAALLTKDLCIIRNIPLIEDVFRMIQVLEALGAKIAWTGKRELSIQCADIDPTGIPKDIVGRFRGSVLTIGPLVARFGAVNIPLPGGCFIGTRPIDTHLDAFLQAGITVVLKDGIYHFKKEKAVASLSHHPAFLQRNVNRGKQNTVVLREFSVTATENIMLFAALTPSRTQIAIADHDYQVQELAKVLKKMGASITGAGTNTIRIKGSRRLKGFTHTLMADPIEAGTFVIAALATKGEVVIRHAEHGFLTLFLKRLRDFGARIEVQGKDVLKVFPSKKLVMDKIQSLPYPGIHSDLQPELGVLATQTKGPTLLHDPLYEGRLKYLEELNKMGADIIFCDPHRAIVAGPTLLHGIEIPSPDIRAGAALLIAALIAKGTTTMHNIYQIDRGYEKIEERLRQLGADIKRVT